MLNEEAADHIPDDITHLAYKIDSNQAVVAVEFDDGTAPESHPVGDDKRVLHLSAPQLFRSEFGVDPTDWDESRTAPVAAMEDYLLIDLNAIVSAETGQ
jgi:hypothetical protein